MSINNVSAVSDAIKYINGMPLEEQTSSITSDIKATVTSPVNGIFAGLQVKDSLMDTFEVKKIKDLKPALEGLGEVQMGQTVGNSSALRSTKLSEQFKAAIDKFVSKADAKKLAKAASSSTELATTAGELATTSTELATVSGEAAASTGKGILGKIGSLFSGAKNAIKSGVSKLAAAIGKTAPGKAISSAFSKFAETGAGKALAKCGKVMKGTGAVGMMVLDGVLGLVTEVIPAFKQGGAKSGVKQIGKTAVKVAGTGLGWAAGTTAATAIGAAIGSVFPGVGTVIGGAVGQFIGGFIGSAIGSGVAKKITGKSEVEKLQEQQVQDAAQQIANDPTSMNELNQQLALKLQSDIESGNITEDTEKIAQYLNSGVFGSNTYSQTDVNATNPYSTNNVLNNPNGMSYWTEMAQRASQGDTSIYNISDEKLESVFSKPASSTSSTTVEQKQEPINYF